MIHTHLSIYRSYIIFIFCLFIDLFTLFCLFIFLFFVTVCDSKFIFRFNHIFLSYFPFEPNKSLICLYLTEGGFFLVLFLFLFSILFLPFTTQPSTLSIILHQVYQLVSKFPSSNSSALYPLSAISSAKNLTLLFLA